MSDEISLVPLTNHHCRLTACGLLLCGDISFEEWERIGVALQRIAAMIQFAIGDWINYGEHKWGERYAQAIEDTGRSYQTLCNYVSVASRVPFYRRREKLSFGHHAEVAALDANEQEIFLIEAEMQGWSVRELRHAIHSNGKQPNETCNNRCPKCGHEW